MTGGASPCYPQTIVDTRRRYFHLALLLLALSVILPFHPAGASGGPRDVATFSVTDFRGKRLTFDRPVTRIVCLVESVLSGIYMLGEEGRVVGVPNNVYTGDVFRYYAEMDPRIAKKSLPAPGNWEFVSIEGVVALRPDVVIIWSKQTETIAALEQKGLRVFAVFIAEFDDVYREMRALGAMTGSLKRAEALVDYTRKELARFQVRTSRIPEGERSRVYFMWAQGPLETSCGRSTVNDLIISAGGRNVCAHMQNEHMVVSIEKILTWSPDVIVMWFNEKRDPGDVLRDPQWRTVRAVKDRRVYELPEVFSCDLWTLKFLYAVKMVAKWSYPGQFRDIDLGREKKAMFSTFYGGRLR